MRRILVVLCFMFVVQLTGCAVDRAIPDNMSDKQYFKKELGMHELYRNSNFLTGSHNLSEVEKYFKQFCSQRGWFFDSNAARSGESAKIARNIRYILKENGFTSSTAFFGACTLPDGYNAIIYDQRGVSIALNSALTNKEMDRAAQALDGKKKRYLEAQKSQQKCFGGLRQKVMSGSGDGVVVTRIDVLTRAGAKKVYGPAKIIKTNPLTVELGSEDFDGQTVFQANLSKGWEIYEESSSFDKFNNSSACGGKINY